MYLLDNLKFDIYAQHTIGDVQYPRGWFSDADNRAAAGVVEVPDPVYPDDNLFTTSENSDGSLTVTARTVEEIAQRQANTLKQVEASIKAERDKRKSGGTLVAGKWFHSDNDSRIQQLGLVMMGASVPVVQWKTMDGTFVIMTQAIAASIFQATAALDMAIFAKAEEHLAAAKLAADPATYDFSAGWPATYLG